MERLRDDLSKLFLEIKLGYNQGMKETLEHCKLLWYPKFFNRADFILWVLSGKFSWLVQTRSVLIFQPIIFI